MAFDFAPYAKGHDSLNGPDDARPTALRIVRDLDLDGKLEDKVFVITGGTSGLGYETARAIHATGGDLYITGRDLKKGTEVAKALVDDGRPGKVVFIHIELDSLDSVRRGALEILERSNGRVNVLINNAGIMMPPYTLTKDNHESQFGINHLAHFQLFHILKPALLASATPSVCARVVNITSGGHRLSPLDTSDYKLTSDYTPFRGYGASKTANIYFSNEITRRYGSGGVQAYSVQPGMATTNIVQYLHPDMLELYTSFPGGKQFIKSAAQGAATIVLVALHPELEGKGGGYFEDCTVSGRAEGDDPMVHPRGYAPWVEDRESARRLWKDSLAMIGVDDE
ncbi:short-chain dehydrogenase [Aspergillus karnatakaensis]|uniref:short-chain dehydrogenase n=1 Tax=Aspergillus karnatakaensis TaxID=1810916 RepID=UPI003CCD4F4A